MPAHCDFSHPQSCECVRRCREYGCPTNSSGARVCHWQIGEEDTFGCYEREGVPPDQQASACTAAPHRRWFSTFFFFWSFSLVPEERAAGIKYYGSSKPGAQEVERRHAVVVAHLLWWLAVWPMWDCRGDSYSLMRTNSCLTSLCSAVLATLGGFQEALPLSKCPLKCSMRGQCSRVESDTPSCACFRGYSVSCLRVRMAQVVKWCRTVASSNAAVGHVLLSAPVPPAHATCHLERYLSMHVLDLNNLWQTAGRGKCEDAFCHCQPPYFSLGCSRSRVYPANFTRPSPVDFKIYMYELGPQLAYDLDLASGGIPGEEHIHMAHLKFIEQFLVSPVRTEDPSQASLFFVPALSWSYGGNDLNSAHLDLVADHLASHYPHWNRSQGRDHVSWLTNDRGSCALSGPTAAAIKLTHFGLTTKNNFVGWAAGSIANAGKPAGCSIALPLHISWAATLLADYGCYHPLRDVVAPPHDIRALPLMEPFRQLSLDDIIAAKSSLLFFTGALSNDSEYSGNTRQLLHELAQHWDDPDIVFEPEGGTGLGDYEARLRASKFCLAVFGYGFGMRLLTCMYAGGIPLVIQEHVVQPLEDVLPYETFSLRLNNGHLPDLPKLLHSVTPEQYRMLVQGLLRYRDAFLWDVSGGGKAFEYTIASLRRRHLNFKSLYY
ncbi:glycosyltransferase like protein [Chlorella vulgaris]